MAAILQTIFSWQKRSHFDLYLIEFISKAPVKNRSSLIQMMVTFAHKTITWTKDNPFHCGTYASPDLNETMAWNQTGSRPLTKPMMKSYWSITTWQGMLLQSGAPSTNMD